MHVAAEGFCCKFAVSFSDQPLSVLLNDSRRHLSPLYLSSLFCLLDLHCGEVGVEQKLIVAAEPGSGGDMGSADDGGDFYYPPPRIPGRTLLGDVELGPERRLEEGSPPLYGEFSFSYFPL